MRRFIFGLAAVAVTACGSSHEGLTLPSTDLQVGGSYGLVSAAGRNLPILAGTTTTQEVDLVADTLVITEPNQWVETSYFLLTAFTDGTTSTTQTTSSGTYAIASGKINFTMTVGGNTTFNGAVIGKNLSLIFNGSSYLYTKP